MNRDRTVAPKVRRVVEVLANHILTRLVHRTRIPLKSRDDDSSAEQLVESQDEVRGEEVRQRPRSRILIYLAIIGIIATLLRFWGGDGDLEGERIFIETSGEKVLPHSVDSSPDTPMFESDGGTQVE